MNFTLPVSLLKLQCQSIYSAQLSEHKLKASIYTYHALIGCCYVQLFTELSFWKGMYSVCSNLKHCLPLKCLPLVNIYHS